jgi:hypothetical protein
MRALSALFLTLALLFVAGCGSRPKLVTVTGKVIHKDKGLTPGSIFFHPTEANEYKGKEPSCLLAADGTFVMRTYPYGNGVPPGDYKVTLSPELAGRIGQSNYGDAAKTPWSVTVPDSGLKDHTFEVK